MKKIISSAVLLTVLVGAVTMIVGCGEKPKKESVWNRSPENKADGQLAKIAFDSDGNFYTISFKDFVIGGEHVIKEDVPIKVGKYSINAANKTITISDTYAGALDGTLIYTENKDTLTIKKVTGSASIPLSVFKKNPNVSAEDLKKVAKVTP